MKFIPAIFLALAFTSCDKEEKNNPEDPATPVVTDYQPLNLTASIIEQQEKTIDCNGTMVTLPQSKGTSLKNYIFEVGKMNPDLETLDATQVKVTFQDCIAPLLRDSK